MTAYDFIHPAGEITQEMFPGETLTENVEEWLEQAEKKSSVADAQEAWVYHRAFKAVAHRFHVEATEVEVQDQVRRSRLISQARYWDRKAEEEKERFESAAEVSTSHAIRSTASDRTFDDDTVGVDAYGGFV